MLHYSTLRCTSLDACGREHLNNCPGSVQHTIIMPATHPWWDFIIGYNHSDGRNARGLLPFNFYLKRSRPAHPRQCLTESSHWRVNKVILVRQFLERAFFSRDLRWRCTFIYILCIFCAFVYYLTRWVQHAGITPEETC